ncbi:MAG TPA: DUF6171 family protein, partial [Pirellulales bacterium]
MSIVSGQLSVASSAACPHLAVVGPHLVCRHEANHDRAHVIAGPEVCAACIIRNWPCANQSPVPTAAEMGQLSAVRGPLTNPPSLLERAAKFGAAMAGFAADGFRLSAPDLAAARLKICQDCDQYRGGKCRACGCHLAAKAAIRRERCPLGKWPFPGNVRGQLSVVSGQSSAATDNEPRTTDNWLRQVTFGITAFDRPRHLERLVASILEHYPGARIVVADNGRQRAALPPSVELLELPYDCGLSAARNAL